MTDQLFTKQAANITKLSSFLLSSIDKVPVSVIYDNNGKILRVFLNNAEQWQLNNRNIEISDKLKKAAICFEDKRFYSHAGIDFTSFTRAVFQNITRD